MPTLKGTEASLSYVCICTSSINVSIFHITWLDTLGTGLILWSVYTYVHSKYNVYVIAFAIKPQII